MNKIVSTNKTEYDKMRLNNELDDDTFYFIEPYNKFEAAIRQIKKHEQRLCIDDTSDIVTDIFEIVNKVLGESNV